MIKLTDVLRNSSKLRILLEDTISIDSTTTEDEMFAQLRALPPGEHEILLNFIQDIPDNEVASQSYLEALQQQLNLLAGVMESGTITITSHASTASASLRKTGVGAALDPIKFKEIHNAVLKAHPKNTSYNNQIQNLSIDNFNSNGRPIGDAGKIGNKNLALNRAGVLDFVARTIDFKPGVVIETANIKVNSSIPFVGISAKGIFNIPENSSQPRSYLHRLALGFSTTDITMFGIQDLGNPIYEVISDSELKDLIRKNINLLKEIEDPELLSLKRGYQWLLNNYSEKMRKEYSVAIYGAMVSPNSSRSKPIQDLLQNFNTTKETSNNNIELKDTTAKHDLFIFDENDISEFFQNVSAEALKAAKLNSRK